MSAAASASGSEDPEPYSRGAPAAPPLDPRVRRSADRAKRCSASPYALFVLLPKLLAVGYGATAGQIGAVMAAFGVASLVTIPLIAPIVKRLGLPSHDDRSAPSCWARRRSASSFIHSAGALAAVLRGAQGIAWSLTFAAGMSLVADVAPPIRLGHGIGLYGAVALATSALGPARGGADRARASARGRCS